LSGLLLDTNVISELRKGQKADRNVLAWYTAAEASSLWLSVLVVGELRRGVERLWRKDDKGARALDRWLSRVEHEHGGRILPVDRAVADARKPAQLYPPGPVR